MATDYLVSLSLPADLQSHSAGGLVDFTSAHAVAQAEVVRPDEVTEALNSATQIANAKKRCKFDDC